MSDLTQLDVVLGWSGVILPLGRFAGSADRRRFDSATWPPLPLTLADNHDGVGMIGPMDHMEIVSREEATARLGLTQDEQNELGDTNVWASGRFGPTPEAWSVASQLAFWGRLPVSIEGRDGTMIEREAEGPNGEPIIERIWPAVTVGAVAVERVPAFAGAWIRPDAEAAAFQPAPDDFEDDDEAEDAEEGLLAGIYDAANDELAVAVDGLRTEAESFRQAGAGPHVFPAAHFSRIDYGGPTRLTISPDGEVTGYPVLWGKTHRADRTWTAAKNPADDLSEWLVGSTSLDDGRTIRTGVIVSDGLHAPAHQSGAHADTVRQLIESTASQVAVVNAWADEHGIAVHGSTLPGVTVEQATRAMAGCPSVDQRNLGDGRGFVTMGVLMVNTCGFTPGDAVVSVEDGEPVRRLVASAAPEGCGCGGTCGGCGGLLGDGPSLPSHWPTTFSPSYVWSNASTSSNLTPMQASADPEPDPPKVVDVAALARADAEYAKARLKAAVAPRTSANRQTPLP